MKYLPLLLLASCGVSGKIDSINVNPIHVLYSFDINFTNVMNYCSNKCGTDHQCAQACYDEFVKILAFSSSQPIPTPTPN